MERIIFKIFKSRLIFGKYSIKYLISKGSFGEVYFGTNVIDGKNYALKIEEKNTENSFLQNECYILLNIKGPGIPSVISYGVSGKYNILVENLLGKSIWDIWNEKNKRFNLKDTCIFAIQAISLLEYVHSKNYLHRDIKPANFLVGNPDNSQIYLIDFGNAKKFRSSKTGKHIKIMKSKLIFGALLFLSMNIFKQIESARKDELESLGLVIIYLFIGSLPWSKIKFYTLYDGLIKIGKIRKNISIENICKGMPKEMNTYMNYIKNLNYEQCPDYEYLRKLFTNVLKKIGESDEQLFSWVDKNKNRTISSRRSTSKNKNRNAQTLFHNLLKKNSNKLNIFRNIKVQSNNNEEKIKKIINLKERKNISLRENNFKNKNVFNTLNSESSEKINNNYKNNKLKKIDLRKKYIKNNDNQNIKKTPLNKKLISFPNNINNKANHKIAKSNIEINFGNFSKDKNLSNIYDELFDKDKNIKGFNNYFNTLDNIHKKEKIDNYINNMNYNINNNSTIDTYSKIAKNNESKKVDINKRNNQIRILPYKTKINRTSLNNNDFRPIEYKSIFFDESRNHLNLTKFGLNLNEINNNTQIETNEIKSGSLNKALSSAKNSISLSFRNNINENKNNFQKCKIYQSKFVPKIRTNQINYLNNYIG